MNALRWTGLAAVLAVGAVGALVGGAQPEKKVGPDPQQWDRMVDRAINYLKTSQSDDGSWREQWAGTPDTCFALLFLKRANVAQDLTETLRQFQTTTPK